MWDRVIRAPIRGSPQYQGVESRESFAHNFSTGLGAADRAIGEGAAGNLMKREREIKKTSRRNKAFDM